MNTIGIALVWCMVQVTLIGLLAAGLYLIIRRLRPAAGATVLLAGLAIVIVLSLLVVSPWPRWAIPKTSPLPVGEGPGVRAELADNVSSPTDFDSATIEDLGATDDRIEPTQITNRPSATALLWQTISDGLINPQPAIAENTWRWPATVAVILLAAMTFGLAWLLLGVLAVRRERLRSHPVSNRELLELVDILCAELTCRRPIDVRLSDNLTTAATIGWRRPAVLLPGDWETWSADQLRAVLAHEIAHVRGRDFPALLFGQIALVLHFYHPLLHWLMGRLRLEQELAADAAAAGISGGQRDYLTTIAELALHRQDRSVPWPARTFLPTQTTFLRRIAMLRNTRLRFDRLSPAVRFSAVGAVLLCGLLVAGIRGPAAHSAASAQNVAAVAEQIDITFFTENPAGIIIFRPSAVFARPELAPLAEMLDASGHIAPRGTKLTDFSQFTAIIPDADLPTWPREVAVYQWVKPIAEAYYADRVVEGEFTVREHNGKKMYAHTRSSRVVFLYDDRTTIQCGSKRGLEAYLADKRGVLPKWLPAKTWESFKDDQFVYAPASKLIPILSREIKHIADRSTPFAQTAFASVAPLWENSLAMAVGAKFDDRLTVHAWTATRSVESSEKWMRTFDALKTLVQSAVDNARATVQASRRRDRANILSIFDVADGLLENLKSRQTENEVRLETSVAIGKAELTALLSPLFTASQRSQRLKALNNMKMITLAMHNYVQANLHFPPAVLYGPDGKTTYSWRVALLPHLGKQDLYKRYRFDEPWDGPNNRKLLSEMPAVFRGPNESAKTTNSSYFVLTGPDTMFDGKKGTEPRAIRDGMSYTILAVEAKRDIPWTKPEDIPYDPDKPLPKLGGYYEGGFIAALADGGACFLSSTANEKTLRLLITKSDQQPVRVDDARAQPVPWIPRAERPPMRTTPTDQAAAKKTMSINNMKQLALALLLYENANHSFPPAYSVGKDGKPLLSWRVLILPFLDKKNKLYEQFHFDEPWDSEHNKKLIAKMPYAFINPKGSAGDGKTNYLTLRNPHSIFPGDKGIRIADVNDGTSNTITLVEVNNDRAVIWTKPDDFQYDPAQPASGLGGLWPEGFLAAFADGSVHMIPKSTSVKVLDALFTRDGGDGMNWSRPGNNKPVTASRGKRYTAVAYLQIWMVADARDLPDKLSNDKEKFEIYKKTQGQLLLSHLVLHAAINNQELAKLPIIKRAVAAGNAEKWLKNQLKVKYPNRAEIMTVSFSGPDPKEAAIVVQVVVDTYLKKVVNDERDRKQARLNELDRAYAEREEMLKKSSDAEKTDPILRQLAEERDKLKVELRAPSHVTLMEKVEVFRTPDK